MVTLFCSSKDRLKISREWVIPALVRDTDTSSHVQNDRPLFTRIRMFLYPCPELDRGAKRSAMTMTVSGGGVTGSNYARSSRASHANWTNRLLPRAPQPPHTKPRLSLTDAAASPAPPEPALYFNVMHPRRDHRRRNTWITTLSPSSSYLSVGFITGFRFRNRRFSFCEVSILFCFGVSLG